MKTAHIFWMLDDGRVLSPDCLPADEQAEFHSFVLPARQRSFLLSRWLLRQMLAQTLPDVPAIFERAENGRLVLSGHSGWQISISHAAGAVAVMAAPAACGVDIEKPRPARLHKVAARYFSSAEQAHLAATPESDYRTVFFRLWTLKEAGTKAIGEGLANNLSRLSFELGGLGEEEDALPRLHGSEPVLQLWQAPADAYWLAGAVATSEPVRWEIRQVS